MRDPYPSPLFAEKRLEDVENKQNEGQKNDKETKRDTVTGWIWRALGSVIGLLWACWVLCWIACRADEWVVGVATVTA